MKFVPFPVSLNLCMKAIYIYLANSMLINVMDSLMHPLPD